MGILRNFRGLTMNELAQQSQNELMDAIKDVTDHVYHTLSMFEQLASRLETRCLNLDGHQPSATISNEEIAHVIATNIPKMPDYRAIAPLLQDPTINDILINGANQIFVERQGVMELTPLAFESEEELAQMAIEIAEYCGRRLDGENSLVDARLPDGSRVNIVIPPVAIDGVSLSIRKFSGGKHTLESMAKTGGISDEMAVFLRCCGNARANMVISGGTGSGKTTLLNAICKNIGERERVVTIEDSAELQLPIKHVVRLESITHEQKGQRIVTIRDLVKNALRMRPERIIVGEVRGSEAFDMIQAMNTGHDGSLTTIHANTPRDGLARIENMIGMAGLGLPTIAIRKQMASAIHFIIQAERSGSGHRHVSRITEVIGIEGDVVTMQDIFVYKEEKKPDGSTHGSHAWTGTFPRHPQVCAMVRQANILKVGR
ncbi:MAG: CpaF family protein [Alphaproteobacteria bacterium]|nr:MAG: CpaF family protein [Alphaproteobacteria bacterium]TAF41996.1 MAG: CpaF family protein [Alphaproteobacteria bacterium]TAF76604.1 MAG: CpaF family protein [Alphaproteobacteria bacterium]